ncbi:ankyrin repeat domain-containing protein 17-like [Cloeon dipterum]|uniref:ankyrin repeat domain-containing protein 17-like n=1 Tax=Cloeon dipterum TaxID=197152 RepID=UPI0032207C24
MDKPSAKNEDYDDLFRACAEGKLEKVKQLMTSRTFDIEKRNKKDETLLVVATMGDHVDVIQFLLEMGADIEGKCTSYQQTPLLAAAFFSKLKTFQFLESRGANIDAVDNMNGDAFMRAADSSNLELMKYLVNIGKYNLERRNSNGMTPWIKAARNTSIEVKKHLVELGANIHATDRYNLGAMTFAAKHSDVANCKYLLEIGVSHKVLTYRKETTLHHACFCKNLDTARFLLENGLVDVNAKTKHRMTALDIVRRKNYTHLEELLLRFGAK